MSQHGSELSSCHQKQSLTGFNLCVLMAHMLLLSLKVTESAFCLMNPLKRPTYTTCLKKLISNKGIRICSIIYTFEERLNVVVGMSLFQVNKLE